MENFHHIFTPILHIWTISTTFNYIHTYISEHLTTHPIVLSASTNISGPGFQWREAFHDFVFIQSQKGKKHAFALIFISQPILMRKGLNCFRFQLQSRVKCPFITRFMGCILQNEEATRQGTSCRPSARNNFHEGLLQPPPPPRPLYHWHWVGWLSHCYYTSAMLCRVS